MEPFLGQICFLPWAWTPQHWARCDGQILQIIDNQALYALLGNNYGGDGRQTFALPKIAPIKTEASDVVYAYIALQGIFPPRS